MTKQQSVIVAAGGTGGHVYPAAATSAALLRRGYRVAFVTDDRGAAYPGLDTGVTKYRVASGRLGGGLFGVVKGVSRIVVGTRTARKLIRQLGTSVAIGFGGYPSVPPMLAASRSRVPTIVHEQNAVLGRANRLLAGRATAIALSFPVTQRLPKQGQGKVRLVGNPVRSDIAALADKSYRAPDNGAPIEVLITGGSQGASVLSKVVPDAISQLPEALRARLRITQQCRAEDLESVRARYAAARLPAHLSPFIEDMAGRLAAAHLVISRSGASTSAELTAAGRPAVLVPYPHAADDHQTANARAIAEAGGAWLMPQGDFVSERLAERLAELFDDPARLQAAAAAAATLGHADAAERLADLVEATLSGHPVSEMSGERAPGGGDAAQQLYEAAE